MLLFSIIAMSWAETAQSLVYDLSVKGKPIGTREITIQYLPATSTMPYGSRLIESWTEVELEVAGKTWTYQQRATGHFSEYKSRFVSSVSLNDKVFELQGKQTANRDWIIYDLSDGAKEKKEFKSYQLETVSLALFDPGQSHKWQDGSFSKIYDIEMGELWSGQWTRRDTQEFSVGKEIIYGRELRYSSDKIALQNFWSDTGLLVDFQLEILGVVLDADIRNIPDLPQFGNIQVDDSFQGVQEEKL